ncbi:MAG: hypothetical protein HY722_04830 [Planctomycetes bacterium]|nr:hypothetical protein [Planctomycetota bacterium]
MNASALSWALAGVALSGALLVERPVVDHGHAGTPTVSVDLDAIEATHERARAAFEAPEVAPPLAEPTDAQAILSLSFRTALSRASGPETVRRLSASAERRFLPAGTELFFYAADAPEDLVALAALPPHVEAYCIRYTSLRQVFDGARGRRVQPLADDHLPRALGVAAYPARVVVLFDGALEIHEGL